MDYDPTQKDSVEELLARRKTRGTSPTSLLIGVIASVTLFGFGAYEWLSGANPGANKYCLLSFVMFFVIVNGHRRARRMERAFGGALDDGREVRATDETKQAE